MTTTLTDNPVTRLDDDAFGFAPFLRELHRMVDSAEPLPLTVGVFGPWGSGKSSFLKMWEDVLTTSTTTRTLWFNPWKYDQKIEVWAALIQSLLAEMKASENEAVRRKAFRLAKTAAWLGLRAGVGIAAGALTGGLVGKTTVDEVIEGVAKDDSGYYREVNRFEYDFSDAVGQFVGEGGRLVVFVDDLDRCTPEAALSVLEALKLFVGDARCVFVLAMDFDLLAAVARRKFGQDIPVAGEAYLEKIVQLPFFLPDVGFDQVRSALAPSLADLGDSEALWELIQLGFGANPRRIKRFVNVFNLAAAIARSQGVDTADSVAWRLQLAKLLIIRSEHRALFRHLLIHPEALEQLENSPALPPPGSGQAVVLTHEQDRVLADFLKSESLTRLLDARGGGYHDHPPAPSGPEVERMLRTVRLLTGPQAKDPDAESPS